MTILVQLLLKLLNDLWLISDNTYTFYGPLESETRGVKVPEMEVLEVVQEYHFEGSNDTNLP